MEPGHGMRAHSPFAANGLLGRWGFAGATGTGSRRRRGDNGGMHGRTEQHVVAFGLVAALLLAMKDVPLGQANGWPARPYLSVAPHVASTQHRASVAGKSWFAALL